MAHGLGQCSSARQVTGVAAGRGQERGWGNQTAARHRSAFVQLRAKGEERGDVRGDWEKERGARDGPGAGGWGGGNDRKAMLV